ncbi:MAG: aminotransferase class V-fold PLP-dependent enzyme [Vicinamibacteraceae bacterium]
MSAVALTGRPSTPARGAVAAGAPRYLLEAGLVYLNTGSVGPASQAILDRTVRAWREIESNPVGMIYGNGAMHQATDVVRQHMATFLGCTADELLLTRSTTDAMNSLAFALQWAPGDRVLTTDQEHHGGSVCWSYLARRQGIVVDRVAIATTDHDPAVIVERLAAAVTAKTKVISVSHVITTTGLRMPIAEIAALARSRGALCVVDGAQAVGHVPVDVRALGCHAYAACGHKWLLGPKGTGLLFISRDAEDRIQPVQREEGRRFVVNSTGIGSLPLVLGLGAAVEQAQAVGAAGIERRIMELRARVYAGIQAISALTMASPASASLGTGLVAVRVPDTQPADALRDRLRDRHRVIVKMVEKQWFNGIRLSAHIFNTEADVDAALAALRAELA